MYGSPVNSFSCLNEKMEIRPHIQVVSQTLFPGKLLVYWGFQLLSSRYKFCFQAQVYFVHYLMNIYNLELFKLLITYAKAQKSSLCFMLFVPADLHCVCQCVSFKMKIVFVILFFNGFEVEIQSMWMDGFLTAQLTCEGHLGARYIQSMGHTDNSICPLFLVSTQRPLYAQRAMLCFAQITFSCQLARFRQAGKVTAMKTNMTPVCWSYETRAHDPFPP